MNFKVVEKVRNHNDWDSVKGFCTGLLKVLILLILIPLLLFFLLFDIFKSKDIEKVKNEWRTFYSNEDLKLERIFIDENALPDNLDYPEEANDIYLFHIKAEPQIPGLNNKFFDFQFVTIDQGILLLSFNKQGDGMTIWFIDSEKLKLEKVKDLKSSWWDLHSENGVILLRTTLDKRDIEIKIEKTDLKSA